MEDRTIQGAAMFGAVKDAQGLFANINKNGGGSDSETINPEDEYTSKMPDEEIKILVAQWQKDYDIYYADIEKLPDKSTQYWLGKQKVDMVDSIEGKDIIVNQLFQAIETFIPIATRANPEPLVKADNSNEGQALAKDIKEALVYQADVQKLRRKLAKTTRHWLLCLVGVIEVDYDVEIDDIKTTVLYPKRLIFDKEGYIDESGLFQGEYLGIKCRASASKLAELFPGSADYIKAISGGKKATKLDYIKWWYKGTDIFFTMKNEVLGKFKNPHWNYDGETVRIDSETNTEIIEQVQGKNHLKRPTAPLVFLSIFNTGLQPHDNTSLILQNIPQQDQINTRYRQLDKNINSQNNGLVVDGRVMTQEQAGEAAGALRRGASIRVQGNPNEVIVQRQAPQLAGDVWKSVEKAEANLANIFGTSGSTPSGIKSEETARGKIMVNQMDASRIGGGVTEYIEQVADTIYNLWVQMMFVHYDNIHYINILGQQEGTDLVQLSNSRFTKSLTVTVKEGTLIPKDPLTQRNEAIDLWSANAIDPLNLYKKLDFADPNTSAQNLILWQLFQKGAIPPEAYLPSFQMKQAPAANVDETVPGTGDSDINAPTGPDLNNPVSPVQGTQEAADVQSKQLLQSVPIQ